jgi:hypothetical protein
MITQPHRSSLIGVTLVMMAAVPGFAAPNAAVPALASASASANANAEAPRFAATNVAATEVAGRIANAMGCACFVEGELHIDRAMALSDAACSCAYAERVRADVRSVGATIAADADAVTIALAVEEHLLTRSPDYERMLRYDDGRYNWFLENVRCLCEGCKATVYFSHCQLTCAPGIVYKRRARIFLALGISVDGLIDFYLAEHNATHATREQVDRAFLLPKAQRRRGWLVPAIAIIGIGLLLAFLLRRLVRRGRQRTQAQRSASLGVVGSGSATSDRTSGGLSSGEVGGGEQQGGEQGKADAPISARDRARLDAALEDLDLAGGD